jgi:hypothetical protein
MVTLFALALACRSCHELPYDDQDPPPPPPDTNSDRDSGDSGDSAQDSGPPPLCDHEETEPNDTPDAAEALAMERWACGDFLRAYDADWFTFTSTQAGWIEVRAEASERGSPADVWFQFLADGISASAVDSYLSADARLVFPADAPGTYQFALGEEASLYGEDYRWYAMASLVKQPATWTLEEAEPNDSLYDAQDFAVGNVLMGTAGEAGDRDWYRIVTPDVDSDVTFSVTAYKEGSVADLKLVLYKSDGVTMQRTDRTGENGYDPDPYFVERATAGTEWYLLVRTEDDRGSPYHWYTINLSSVPTGS